MPATQPGKPAKVLPPTNSSRHLENAPTLGQTQSPVGAGHQLGCSEYLYQAIQFGIWGPPSIPFDSGDEKELGDVPLSEKGREFASIDIADGCRSGVYQEISTEYTARARQESSIMSSAFVVWQEDENGEEKGKFVVNLC